MSTVLSIQYPWALTLLPLLLVLWLVAGKSLAPLTPRRRTMVLFLRCILLLCVVGALADIRWLGTTRQHALVWLIDVSDSVGKAALEKYAALQPEADAAASRNNTILFAGNARLVDASAVHPDSVRDSYQPNFTRLRGALQFAMATLPDGYTYSIVLLSDGQSDDSGAELLAEPLAAAGIRLHALTVTPPDEPEVLVRTVEAPAQVRRNEPFVVESEIISNRDQPARLAIYRNGILADSREVELTAGANRFRFNQSLDTDSLTEYIVTVHSEQDRLLDNNQRTALVQSTGEPRVLLVTDLPPQAGNLVRAMRMEGIHVDVRPESGVPDSLADLQNYELLVLDNIPATALSERQFDLFTTWVGDFGGGFLMLGGDQSFGLGGYHRTPLDEMLPLQSEFELQEDRPSTALMLVIDKSGSMQGERMEMARNAANGAIDLLTPSDYAGVIAFDGSAYVVSPMQPVLDRYGIQRAISGIDAGGGTNLSPAMELAAQKLALIPAQIKHVIILSDGHSQSGPFRELTMRLTQMGATVSTVGVGAGTDVALLEGIARNGNGRFYYTEKNTDVPQIIARETMTASRSALNEIPFAAAPFLPAPFLNSIDFNSAPFLYGHVKTEARPTAEVWLVTDEGAPLLASWRHGLGTVGAFTSDARNRWALEWTRWDAYSRFWAQTFRHLMRSAQSAPYSIQVVPAPGGREVIVDALAPDGGFADVSHGSVLLLTADAQRQRIELRRAGPGHYRALLPATDPGNYHFHMELPGSNGAEPIQHYAAFSVGYADEYLLLPPDEALLDTLAAATGGSRQPASLASTLATDDRRAHRQIPLWPWFLAVGLAVFLADVAARRLPDSPHHHF